MSGKPMDPERLALIRRLLTLPSPEIPTASLNAEGGGDVFHLVDELLRAHDHWEAESKRLMAKSIQLHRSQGEALDMGERWHDQALDANATIAALRNWEELAKLAQAEAKRWRSQAIASARSIAEITGSTIEVPK